jgi:hypothetical protein
MKYFLSSAFAFLFLLVSSGSALADPPLGTWVGDHGSIMFTLSPDGTYVMPPSTTGTWSWNQTGPTGGILTLAYTTVTMTQNFPNYLYFSIEFTGPTTATLTDPASGQSDTIRRQ